MNRTADTLGAAVPRPAGSASLEVRNPADLRCVVAKVPAMDASEVSAIYEPARAGFETWRRTNPLDRAAVLATCASLVRSRADEGAVTLVRENGKTLAEARVEIAKTADFLDYYASFARQPWGETSGWDVHHPFGGFRESGSAFKEQGPPGLRFYTRVKTAAVRFAW